jgi:hypothetical protein
VAVEDLAILYGAVAMALRENPVEVLDYLWFSMGEVIKAIDHLHRQVQVWEEVVGNFAVLHEDRGATDICSKLTSVLGDVDALKLDGRLDEVLQRFDVWEWDNIRNLTHLNNKVKGLIKVQAAPPPIVTQGQLSLCLLTPITDANGIRVGVFGDIMWELDDLKANNVKLSDRLEAIKVDVTAQGSVMFGHCTFTSELQIIQDAMSERPQGDAFALFLELVSIFCHDTMYSPGANWQKDTKAMEELGVMSTTDRKVVASYNLNNSFWATKGKQVVTGKGISAFTIMEKCLGSRGMDGRRVEIKHAAETAGDCVRTVIEDKLPTGSKLAQLAAWLLEHTQAWIQMVHKHLDSKVAKLTQMGIPEEESLILLSEAIIIMVDHFYTIRRKRIDFTIKSLHVQYMVWCIWLAM